VVGGMRRECALVFMSACAQARCRCFVAAFATPPRLAKIVRMS